MIADTFHQKNKTEEFYSLGGIGISYTDPNDLKWRHGDLICGDGLKLNHVPVYITTFESSDTFDDHGSKWGRYENDASKKQQTSEYKLGYMAGYDKGREDERIMNEEIDQWEDEYSESENISTALETELANEISEELDNWSI
jgi:hypothetical protein